MPSANPAARFQIADVMEGREPMSALEIAQLADMTRHGAEACLAGMFRRGEVRKVPTEPNRYAFRLVRRPVEAA